MRSATVAYCSALKNASDFDIGCCLGSTGIRSYTRRKAEARAKKAMFVFFRRRELASRSLLGAVLLRSRHRRDRGGNGGGDLVFHGEDVLHVAIVDVGPLHDVVRSAAQARRHAQTISNALDGSLEHHARVDVRSAGRITRALH